MSEQEAVRIVLESFAKGTENRRMMEKGVYNVLIHADATWDHKELARRIVNRILGDRDE